ncbi:MAG: hypothetical protein U0350_14400 [Caldilineaceae bacterium]
MTVASQVTVTYHRTCLAEVLVRLDPEVQTLVWPNGADFDPATLYNWPRGDGAELAQRAARWRKKHEQLEKQLVVLPKRHLTFLQGASVA